MFYSGLFFRYLQNDKSYKKLQSKDKQKNLTFFFCLGLKHDQSSSSVPFYKNEDEINDSESINSNYEMIDNYYTSYNYTFKYNVNVYNKFKNFSFNKASSKFFQVKRRRRNWKKRRKLRWMSYKRKYTSRQWLSLYIKSPLRRKKKPVNPIGGIFVDTFYFNSLKLSGFYKKFCYFYNVICKFFSQMFNNIYLNFFRLHNLQTLYFFFPYIYRYKNYLN